MKTTQTVVLVGVMAFAASLAAAADETGKSGRYQGVEASSTAVWVIDTQTGRVRKCTQEFADAPPACSVFSK